MSDPDSSRQLIRNARREAWIVFWVWAAALLWTVGWYHLFGSQHDEASFAVRLGLAEAGRVVQPKLVLGFPDWVFWGIILPWLACSVFTVWFGMKGVADADLGAEAPSPQSPLPEGEGHSGGGRHGH